MPVIKVYGVPNGEKQKKLEKLIERLHKATVGVRVLGLMMGQVSVFIVKDHVEAGLGEEIIVEVACLFDRPERTPKVVELLCHRLVVATKRFFPNSFVEAYDTLQRGYASTANLDG